MAKQRLFIFVIIAIIFAPIDGRSLLNKNNGIKSNRLYSKPYGSDALQSSSRSQHHEDVFMVEQLYNNTVPLKGFYIEAGGHDGVSISNTYLFEKLYNWKGMMVEASPVLFPKLKLNRGNENNILYHGALCDVNEQNKILHWADADAVSGIYEFMDEGFKRVFHSALVKNPLLVDSLPVIKCLDLMSLLLTNNISHVDFFSLDVEGAEMTVLKNIDFKKIKFDIIAVESYADQPDNPKQNEIIMFLKSRNFYHLWGQKNYGWGSAWFINKFSNVYKSYKQNNNNKKKLK